MGAIPQRFESSTLRRKKLPNPKGGKKNISKQLGANIKRIRTEKGMTQGDIVRALDLDRGYVSSLENGKRNPTLAMIEKIAGALGVSSDELLK